MNKSFNKIILSTVAMIPMGGIALKDLSSSGINFNYEARDCGGTTIEHKNVDLNPSSSQQLDDTYDKFNSTSDKTKYEKVWSTSGHKNEDGTYEDPGSSFGAGNTYSKTFDLANMLDSENSSWVSEVRINTSERFDFYKGLLPFSTDENGNIINPYEWSAKVVAINGEESFNPETTLINNGDIISIEFTHNRTIDPNATVYGDGIMDMEVKF